MRWLPIAMLLSCRHPLPPLPVVTPFDSTIPTCKVDPRPTALDVCEGLYTQSGLACVKCPNAQGCLDSVDVVYCVETSCVQDTTCKFW